MDAYVYQSQKIQDVYIKKYLDISNEQIIANVQCSTNCFNSCMPHIYYDISCTNCGTVICKNGFGSENFVTIENDDNDEKIDSLYGLVCKSIRCTRQGIDMEFYDVIIVKKQKKLTENDIEKIKQLFTTTDICGMTLHTFNDFSDFLKSKKN